MSKKLICLASFVVVLSLVGPVQAENITWTGAIDSNWLNPDNWDLGRIPESGDIPRIEMPGPVIDAPGPICKRLDLGRNAEGDLTIVDGGTLDVTGGNDDINLGRGGGKGTLNVFGGTITISRDLDISDQADSEGVVNMIGGTLNIGDDLELPNIAGNTGTFNMVGGTINLFDNLDMLEAGDVKFHLRGGTINLGGGADLQLDDPGEFNIGGGTLIINGDALATVHGYIDANMINAYGGPNYVNGTVLLEYDPNTDQTMVKAVHKYNPIPADGSIALPDTDKLQWTIDPVTVVNVWFGTTPEWSGLTWEKIVDAQAVTSIDMPVDLVPKTPYYWAVDIVTPEGNIYGPIFSFVIDNAPPVVKAGADVTTWIDNGSVEVALSGTVEDTDPTTTFWTVITEPNEGMAVIANPDQTETTVTLSALGTYVLQLEADDGEYKGADTLTIGVFSDHCEAAKSLPGWTASPGDLNLDCVVDQLDMDILLEQWLECTGLDCPDPNAL